LAPSLRRFATVAACLTSYWCGITLHIHVYYAQRQVSASLWNARAYTVVEGVHTLKMYTNITLFLTWRLQSWHKGKYTASAHHHSLWQTTQCESHPVRGAQVVGASLHGFPLNWRRNTQIQMDWLWKWLESNNNCTFSTWKDKFVFSLLFWIPNSFCTFHDYGRGGTSFLASPDGPSLIFHHSDFWTTFLPWKAELPWKFSLCWNIFLSFRTFEQLALALKNRVCPEFTVLHIYF